MMVLTSDYLLWNLFISVTTVESGRRALEFLGLDEQQNSSVKLDVRSFYQTSIYFCISQPLWNLIANRRIEKESLF